MPTASLRRSASWLQQTLASERADNELLAAFAGGDEGAFAELVRRHGPMVLGVCERALGNRDDAEDAFQSTFLELSRQARRGGWRDSLAGWLHDVAWRTANRMRTRGVRRRHHEQRATTRPPAGPDHDLPDVLDEEVRKLPAAMRDAVLCCYFQGLTRQQAAAQLGWSLRTLERRLEQGRRRLRQRLESRGEPLPALLAGPAASLPSLLGRWWLVAGVLLVAGAGLAARSGTAPPPPIPNAAAPPSVEAPLPPGAVGRLGQTKFVGGFMINHVCYSPDGKVLASGGNGRGLCLWDATTGKLLHHCTTRRFPSTYSAAFSPDGRRVVTTEGTPLDVWDVATGKKLLEFKGHTNGVLTVAWADNGKWIASASHDATVRVWDAESGKELHRLEGHASLPRQIAFAPGSKLLASVGLDRTVRVWDPATGKQLHCHKGAAKELRAIAFSPDGSRLAWLGEDGELCVWPTDGKSPARTLANGGIDGWSVAFSPDGRTLASGWRDGSVRLIDTRTGKERRWHAGVFSIYSLAYSPDGKTLATGGTWGSTVRRWDPATGKEIDPGTGHAGPVDRLFFTRGGEALLSFGRDHRVICWDLATRAPTAVSIPSYGSFVIGAFSPDGKLVALAGRRADDTRIKIHDTATGARIREIAGHEGLTLTLAFSRDGKRLASAGQDGTLRVWNVGDGKQVWVDEERRRRVGFIVPLHFSPDDRLLLYGGPERKARLFDAATGKVLHEYGWGDGVHGADFSPDGKLAAFVGSYGNPTVVLWDTATGKVTRSWQSGQSGIHNVAFSPDGRLLATGGDDNYSTVKLWDVATNQELAHFKGHHSAVLSVAFSRDGRTLASGSGDATVLLWDVTGRAWAASKALTPKRLQELWEALADEDAKKVDAAAWELALSPDGAVPFLRGRVAPVKAADAAPVERLVKQLGSDEYDSRQAATRQLEALGAGAIPRLSKALEAGPDLEVRRRLEAVIATYSRSDEWQRQRQALAVLERGGSAAAVKLVDELARGAEGAPLTEEARAVVERRTRLR
jgi:RNA polymerase sigma factor (sigma-70 family)